MSAPAFVGAILGLRKGVPNNADVDSETSKRIAGEMLRLLGAARPAGAGDPGTALENGVRDYLAVELPARDPDRTWQVERRRLIADFEQYRHLASLDRLIRKDPTGTLAVEIGRDYLIRPDVTVGVVVDPDRPPILHAAISCKWTIRSDRVQNIRHEGVILTRHRRGRQPHIVTVTVEPLPSRIAAIARGTGEVDAVYHAALEELQAATRVAGTEEQQRVLEELVGQNRLKDFVELPAALVL
ncbi:MAG TPA: NgoMIV family type II restriction endonuclease [Actinomycetota bacterium]|nr:NgoMIV family type II restriction endonuclease [Actinomycetota bacterium]